MLLSPGVQAECGSGVKYDFRQNYYSFEDFDGITVENPVCLPF